MFYTKLENEQESLQEQLDEEEEAERSLEKQLAVLNASTAAYKKKSEKGADARKLQAEVEDLTMEFDSRRGKVSVLEKIQRKFVQFFADEKAISENEKLETMQNKRLKENKILSVKQDIEEKEKCTEELERKREQLLQSK
ncbi:hypothetical protein TNCT_507901 [Trichonephila clavata]|uniref:Myosin tail domain-containing protein n=1 Tax=Trichonephila clavata TaxID=2740835 RepID=A0A8X6FVJ7_TRICU|nr:hypothetical protein TNCT_507901 [Trichonephila clavata]